MPRCVNFVVRQKIAETTATMRTLSPLWTDSQISTAWKLVLCNAVIRSRIFHTLETLELTQGHQRKLDTLYFRGLRRILRKQATYIDRTWTHERLLQLVNTQNARAAPTSPKHRDFSTYYLLKRRKLIAHLITAPTTNLCRLAILTPESQDLTATGGKKRIGRPRFTWLQEGLKEVWGRISQEEFERDFPALLELAVRRAPPF